MGVLLIVGSSIALVFLTISAYFCVRKRLVSRGGGGTTGNRNSGGGGAEIRPYSVGYNVESSNVVVSEANEFETSMNPDVIPRSKGMICYYFKVLRYRYSTYLVHNHFVYFFDGESLSKQYIEYRHTVHSTYINKYSLGSCINGTFS